MRTKRGWWSTAVPLAVPLVGLLAGCATQQDMLEQDRKLTNMIEQQTRSVEAMRKDLEQMRNETGRGRTAPSTRPAAPVAPRPGTKPKAKPEDTSLLPPGTAPPADALQQPGGAIGMTLSPEGQSREDAPVAETVVSGGGQTGSTASAPAAAPAAGGGGGFVGEAVAATPPPTAEAPAPRVATDPEWRREVAQERAVARATGGAEQQKYVDALQGIEQGDCKKALARLKATSGSGGSLSDNAMYWQAKCLAARGNQRKANARLSEVVNRYPKSDKAPAALWAQAELQQKSGDPSAARGTLSKLVKDYPASAEASRAKKKLAESN